MNTRRKKYRRLNKTQVTGQEVNMEGNTRGGKTDKDTQRNSCFKQDKDIPKFQKQQQNPRISVT